MKRKTPQFESDLDLEIKTHLSLDELEMLESVKESAKSSRNIDYKLSAESKNEIEEWWSKNKKLICLLKDAAIQENLHKNKSNTRSSIGFEHYVNTLRKCLSKTIQEHDQALLNSFRNVAYGKMDVGFISVKNMFDVDDELLAYIVHEAMCDIAGLLDTHYEYENHKTLYVEDPAAQDYGKGGGIINAHSDDLYESGRTDILALTTCRNPNSATIYIPLTEILDKLGDEEIIRLTKINVKFISGINVNKNRKGEKPLEIKKKIIEYDNDLGVRFYWDNRDESKNRDHDVGKRMQYIETKDQEEDKYNMELILKVSGIISKIQESSFRSNEPDDTKVDKKIGDMILISNLRGLHCRDRITLHGKSIEKDENQKGRLLYRSKGRFSLDLFLQVMEEAKSEDMEYQIERDDTSEKKLQKLYKGYIKEEENIMNKDIEREIHRRPNSPNYLPAIRKHLGMMPKRSISNPSKNDAQEPVGEVSKDTDKKTDNKTFLAKLRSNKSDFVRYK